jgi:hypothetical protein
LRPACAEKQNRPGADTRGDSLLQVVCSTVRRLWVVAGLLGLVVGLGLGFLVGARFRLWPWKAAWVEAAGTWVGALATLLAVFLGAVLVFFSEEFNRRREMQRAANHVFCDIRNAGTYLSVGRGTVAVDKLEIEVDNRSGSVVTDVMCELRLGDFEWSKGIDEPIDTGKVARRDGPPLESLQVRHDGQDLRANATFTFSLDEVQWSKRYGQSAKRRD